jgi:hypothetical protein
MKEKKKNLLNGPNDASCVVWARFLKLLLLTLLLVLVVVTLLLVVVTLLLLRMLLQP